MRTCSRLGLTLAQWKALDEDEQIDWLAWDLRRKNRIDKIRESIQAAAEEKDAPLYTPDVAVMLMLAEVD